MHRVAPRSIDALIQ